MNTEWNCFCTIDGCGREFVASEPTEAATLLYTHQVNAHDGSRAIKTIAENRRAVKVKPTTPKGE